MDWLEDWPNSARPFIQKICQNIDDYDSIRIKKDISGRSGAKTYLGYPQSKIGAAHRVIIKIGNTIDIEKEKQDIVFFSNTPKIIDDFSIGSEKCIVMEFSGNYSAKTFEEYYHQEKNIEKIVDIIKTLFSEYLRNSVLTLGHSNLNVFEVYNFDNPTKINRELIYHGDEMPGSIHWIEKANDACTTIDYKGTLLARQHGDLHSRNIIISNNDPYIIDFGLTRDDHHAWRDMAKMEREVRLFLFLEGSTHKELDTERLNTVLADKELENADEIEDFRVRKAFKVIKTIRSFSHDSKTKGFSDFQYNAALHFQFIYAACNPELKSDKRRIAVKIARQLRDELNEHLNIQLDEEGIFASRKSYLNYIAYALFKLDQLPKGGWGKTLANWMEALWEGDLGKIPRDPGMRNYGGVDLTTYAFYSYFKFLKSLCGNNTQQISAYISDIAEKVAENIKSRIAYDGAVGLVVAERTAAQIKIRHTLMGIINLLLCRKVSNFTIVVNKEIKQTCSYLLHMTPNEGENLRQWKEDKSHYLSLYAAMVKLHELINTDEFTEDLDEETLSRLHSVADIVNEEIEEVNYVVNNPNIKSLIPDGQFRSRISKIIFKPYACFWRMEFTNLFMNIPYFITEDGESFNSSLDSGFVNKIIKCLKNIVTGGDIAEFSAEQPEKSLLFYHRDPENLNLTRYRDWGITAEYLSIIKLPAIKRRLLNTVEEDEYQKTVESIQNALIHTFDQYHKLPNIFHYTTGVSFFRYLNSISFEYFDTRHLDIIETELRVLHRRHFNLVSEDAISSFLYTKTANGMKENSVDISSIKDMLINKLESGEYINSITQSKEWSDKIDDHLKKSTIKFYELSDSYIKRYKNHAISTFVTRLEDIKVHDNITGRTALDLGCGPGQYAKIMQDRGYDVTLFDASERMIQEAKELTSITDPEKAIIGKIDTIGDKFPDNSFDVIFACAMMIHVPKDKSMRIYNQLYQLIKPGGLLFVNYKIGDHHIVSEGGGFLKYQKDFLNPEKIIEDIRKQKGKYLEYYEKDLDADKIVEALITKGVRFFEYYNSHLIPQKKIEAAGFNIEEITFRWNKSNLHDDPKSIYWANFYCSKPNEE